MGLLDDAIREHLELKRRSGADPGDVARLEHEAFGAQQAAEAARAVAAENGEAPAGVAQPVADPPDADMPAERVAPHEHVAPAEPPAPPEPIAPEPAAEAAPAPAEAEGEGEQATRQFTALEAEDAQRPPPADAPSSEDDAVHDELEETPDFLQETPDHDRLWFEQKPPRDFDF